MKFLSIVVFSFILLSCKGKKGYVNKEENNGDAIYNITSDDKDMNKAIEKAKATYPEFLTAFDRQDSTTDEYTIKMRFGYGEDQAEHMWLSQLYYKEKKMYGVLDSDPANIKWVKWGDTLEIKKDSVTDWMYVRDGKLVGGYTIHVLYDKMSDTEKKNFKNEVDFEIE